ncbi:uncharacterized protein LOC135111233 isoform X1 [Scylla paramamosain]|uniref:uncharacterized protein LOC135111233 isoform X1 n=1 Tax=Scylla paramamosain TaxID=85552 RepID=UPI003083AED2
MYSHTPPSPVAMEPSKSSPFTRASPPSSASPPPPNYLGLSSPPSRSAPGTPQRLPNPPVTWQQYRYAGKPRVVASLPTVASPPPSHPGLIQE